MAKRNYDEIESLRLSSLNENENWCLISTSWWTQFKINQEECIPVDNANLVDQNGRLRQNLVEDEDFVLLPERCWIKLESWFGKGGPKISRNVVTLKVVEIYPLSFDIIPLGDKQRIEIENLSRTNTILDLKKKIGEKLKIHPRNMRLYFDKKNEKVPLIGDNSTLHQLKLISGQTIYVELVTPPGIKGLANLGNSCYLNTAVQCMSTIPFLTHFILSGQYSSEINYGNKLTSGKVALAYGSLVQNIWKGESEYLGSDCIIPRDFKKLIGSIDSRWAGFNQQDVQEFMQFLLNVLHDDYNRVKVRPPIIEIDSKDKSDFEIANEIWEMEKSREDSFINDVFRGLFKSHIQCPTCTKSATKFETYLDISLQIPSRNIANFKVTLLLSTGFKPVKFLMTMRNTGTIGELKQVLVSKMGIAGYGDILITEVYQDKFVRFFLNDSETVASIGSRDDIMAYHVTPYIPYTPTGDRIDFPSPHRSLLHMVTIPVLQRSRSPVYSAENKKYQLRTNHVASPFLVTLPRRITYGELHNALKARVRDLVEISEIPNKENGFMEKLEKFCIWKIDNNGIGEGERIFEFEEQSIVLGSDTYLAIEWNLRGLLYKQFTRVRPVEEVEIKLIDTGDESLSLEDCIADFTKAEKLSEDESWFCPDCKENKQATKKIDIWKTPKVLILHLKRFQNRGFWGGRKITKKVECPLSLDLTQTVQGNDGIPPIYELYAVANHFGNSSTMGHYTACCKNPINKSWFYFDDKEVTKKDFSEVVTEAAYLLFYIRQGLDNPMAKFWVNALQ